MPHAAIAESQITPQNAAMLTGAQIRAARSLLGWSADVLAEHSGVHVDTIRRAERAGGVPNTSARNIHAVQISLSGAGIIFIDEGAPSPDGGPGVRLKR